MELPNDFESILPGYPVKLANFEGPLDLLLYLIKKHEVDVYDIPIALITTQYLDYLDLMQELDLDMVGEFLVMASTLIYIKSRLLVPRLVTATDDAGEEDPRDVLVRRLLEHEKFKAAAELLHEREIVRSAQWPRPDSRVEDIVGEPFERELEVDLFSLLQAFQSVIVRSRERPLVMLPTEIVSIEIRIEELLGRLSETEVCLFEDFFVDALSRRDLITTFLALLEMIRMGLIRVFQGDTFGPIRIFKCARPPDTQILGKGGDVDGR
jgi:segregation and condensation protein A